MRTIQIQDGISVNVECIEAVEKKDDKSCKVYVGTRAYEATYPYETFMQILNSERLISKEIPQDLRIQKTMENLNSVLEKAQHFAG